MSELEYDKNWAAELTAVGITPASTPINLRGVLKQIIANSAPIGTYVTASMVDPRSYGAKFNAKRVYGASITTGTNVITLPAWAPQITIFDIGKTVCIVGAGVTQSSYNTQLAQNQFAPLLGFIGPGSSGSTINVVTTSGGSTAANASQTVTASGVQFPNTDGANAPSPTGTCIYGTDDTTALQNAVYAAASATPPQSVMLPGHSVISNFINWRTSSSGSPANGVSLIGNGPGASGLHMIVTFQNDGAVYFHSADSGATDFLVGCTFRDFELDGCGSGATSAATPYKGFGVDHSQNVHVDNCYVHDFPMTGFAFDEAVDLTGTSCHSANNGRLNNGTGAGGAGFGHGAGDYANETSQWVGCIARLNGGYGFFYENESGVQLGYGTNIMGGDFYLNGLAGIGDCGVQGLSVVGAKSFLNTGAGMQVAGATFTSSNPIGQQGLVTGCQFFDNTKAGFEYQVADTNGSGTPTYAGLYTVTGNRMWGNNSGIRFDMGAASTAVKFAITDNDVFGNAEVGIWMRYATGTGTITDVDILNNRVIGNGVSGGATHDDGIRLDVTITGLRIKGNTVTGNTGFGLNIGNTFAGTISHFTCSDNDFIGAAANTAGAVSFAAGVTKTVWTVRDNPGYNPVGSSVPATAFAIGLTTAAASNNSGVDITLYCTAAGTVTAVSVNGVAISGTMAVGDTYRVVAGGTLTLTYSGAPTLVAVGD